MGSDPGVDLGNQLDLLESHCAGLQDGKNNSAVTTFPGCGKD